MKIILGMARISGNRRILNYILDGYLIYGLWTYTDNWTNIWPNTGCTAMADIRTIPNFNHHI